MLVQRSTDFSPTFRLFQNFCLIGLGLMLRLRTRALICPAEVSHTTQGRFVPKENPTPHSFWRRTKRNRMMAGPAKSRTCEVLGRDAWSRPHYIRHLSTDDTVELRATWVRACKRDGQVRKWFSPSTHVLHAIDSGTSIV